jgi:hypothetical protein
MLEKLLTLPSDDFAALLQHSPEELAERASIPKREAYRYSMVGVTCYIIALHSPYLEVKINSSALPARLQGQSTARHRCFRPEDSRRYLGKKGCMEYRSESFQKGHFLLDLLSWSIWEDWLRISDSFYHWPSGELRAGIL